MVLVPVPDPAPEFPSSGEPPAEWLAEADVYDECGELPVPPPPLELDALEWERPCVWEMLSVCAWGRLLWCAWGSERWSGG